VKFGLLARFPLSGAPDEPLEAELRWCRRAEQLGFKSVWLIGDRPRGGAPLPEALIFAAALAASTDRLRIGLLLGERAAQTGLEHGSAFDLTSRLAGGRLQVVSRQEAIGLVHRVSLVETGRQLIAADDPLVGTPEAITARLRQLQREQGDVDVVLDFSGADSLTASLAAIETFSREVMPHFSPQPLLPPTFA
jgi:alkanesulfonate monooxygenase SsuD/methylene tetrahydromethanopterin reductase-like flavin-dependent oxidoreductase (luciferase family)